MSKANWVSSIFAVAMLGVASVVSADCTTWSNGLPFTGPYPVDAVRGCEMTYGTNVFQCQENVRCYAVPGVPGPYPYPVRCGYYGCY